MMSQIDDTAVHTSWMCNDTPNQAKERTAIVFEYWTYKHYFEFILK